MASGKWLSLSLDLAKFGFIDSIPTVQSLSQLLSYNMIPLHHTHASTSRSSCVCKFPGCNHSFKNRTGLKSHMQLVHRPEPIQQCPPHTPNTRLNLQPHIVPLSPSFAPVSPPGISPSESDSDPDLDMLPRDSTSSSNSSSNSSRDNAGDHEDNDNAMDVDQLPSPSPVGSPHPSASPSSTNGHPEPISHSYHPIINGMFLLHLTKLNSKIIYY